METLTLDPYKVLFYIVPLIGYKMEQTTSHLGERREMEQSAPPQSQEWRGADGGTSLKKTEPIMTQQREWRRSDLSVSPSPDWRRYRHHSSENTDWRGLDRISPSSRLETRITGLEPVWRTSTRTVRLPSLSPPSSGGEDSVGRFSFDHSSTLLSETYGVRSRLLSISEEGVATSTPRLAPPTLPPLLTLTPSISPPTPEESRSISLEQNRDEVPRSASAGSSLELVGSDDSKDSNPRFKTEICRNYKEKGSCLYGHECQFAHGHNVSKFYILSQLVNCF